MDTISNGRQAAKTRSGGKILRGRRVAASASPYLRPNSTPRLPESPNWLSRLFSPAAGAARMVAKGVGDLFSPALFGNEISPSSSWSSSNSSSGNDDDGNSDGAEELNLNGGPPEAHKILEEPQLVLWDTGGKRAIEQLVLKETFTRDECDRLTKIIQSRVVDCPHVKEVEDTRQKKLPDRTVGSSFVFPEALQLQLQTRNSPTPNASELERNLPNLCNTAVMEARKWLEEKKLQPSSKSGLDQEMYHSNSIMQLSVAEGDGGSPVDVAKSYMRARPPWTSPSLSLVGSQTPSPIGTRLFSDGTPFGLADQTLSSSKMLKRNTLATGSWDILEEIRRVRLKATKGILEPFAKQIDSSAIVSENIGGKISSSSDKRSTQVGGTVNDSNSLPAIQSVAGTAPAPAGFCNADGSPGNLKHGKSSSTTLVADTVNDKPINGAMSSCPTALVSERTQDLEDSQPHGGEGTNSVFDDSLVLDSISIQNNGPQDVSVHTTNYGPEVKSDEDTKPALQGEATDINGLDDANRTGPPSVSPVCKVVQTEDSCQPLPCSGLKETHSINDSRTVDGNVTQKEENVLGERVTTNGPSLASSLSAGVDSDPGLRPADEEEPNSISSDHGKSDSGAHLEDNCELFSESFIEIPTMEETDSIVSGSQNRSDKQYGDSLQNPLLVNSGDSFAGKYSTKVEKQEVKKMGKYRRRGRRRGKA
ncbi:uncharacterized protein LOC122068269 isoform X2 [Macadamia integrifolia]|uniref:uncharacterized protein LOC122068269 isoform X2 n=1 Tax=Macadamia integrifolia TaxID=60698 RepID=UPI001C4F93D0|nr:uncharacterized protein LOC122068269 isoform X2 [Macadamia integrifolia]